MLDDEKNTNLTEVEDEARQEQSIVDNTSWHYWGTCEFAANLPDIYPDVSSDILKALAATTRKIYELEKEREDRLLDTSN